jgi:hypothetical protein
MYIKYLTTISTVLKITTWILIWILICLICLFVMLSILIEVPVIQKKIINYVTSTIRNITHSKLDITSISLSFPSAILIKGLYLEDKKKDTLLYMGGLKVNIALQKLITHNIQINSVELENVKLNLYNTASDTTFNYQFLINAFNNPAQKKSAPVPKSKWTFNLHKLKLSNIRLHYNDIAGGTYISIQLKQFGLKMKRLDFENSIYSIEKSTVEALNAKILIKKQSLEKEKNTTGALPYISIDDLQIKESVIKFNDGISNLSLHTFIKNFDLKNGTFNLQKEVINADKISLLNSKVSFADNRNNVIQPKPSTTNASRKSNWKVTAKEIKLVDNSLSFKIAPTPLSIDSFNSSNWELNHFNFLVKDLLYSTNNIHLSILKFSAIDNNNFNIKQFETDFMLDKHSIAVNNLKLKTTNSSINADLKLSFPSLESLQDSLSNLKVFLKLENSSISHSDLHYFIPKLTNTLQNRRGSTNVNATILGSVDKLKGRGIVIKTGRGTVLKTDFFIDGLPKYETAFFSLPNFKLHTNKTDLKLLVGSMLPDKMDIPQNLDFQFVFKGKIKSFQTKLDLNCSFGTAQMTASIDPLENFNTNMKITNFDLGSLLMDKNLYGPLSMNAVINGNGLKLQTVEASVKANFSELYLNKYNYQNLNIVGQLSKEQFDGNIRLKDDNLDFDFNGQVNIKPKEEAFKFDFNLIKAKLQKLNLTKDDFNLELKAHVDLTGKSVDKLNGSATVTNIIIGQNEYRYKMDSVMLTSVNGLNNSELHLRSPFLLLNYKGNQSPIKLPLVLNSFVNNYFPLSTKTASKIRRDASNFNFDIELKKHPIVTELFFPQLKVLEMTPMTGSFDSNENKLVVNATIKKLEYGSNEINDFNFTLNSDKNALNYNLFCKSFSNSQLKVDNLLLNGNLSNNKIKVNLSSIDQQQNKKLVVSTEITRNNNNFKLKIEPNDFYLMNEPWEIAPENYILFGKNALLIHHLYFKKDNSELNINSLRNKINDDIIIDMQDFKLSDISKIIEKNENLLKGSLDGNILLQKKIKNYGLIADADISELTINNHAIGNLSIKAENPTAEKFNIDIKLKGEDNNLQAKGSYLPNGGENSININTKINSLSMRTIEAFAMGEITEASGKLIGNILISGKTNAPDISGKLTFDKVLLTPTVLNNKLSIVNENINFNREGIYFNTFKVLDENKQNFTMDGSIKMKQFSDFIFDLKIKTKDFLLFNTTEKQNKTLYGKLFIDSDININGSESLPIINAKLKIKKGSNISFTVPESKLTADKGESLVLFDEQTNIQDIKKQTETIKKTASRNFDFSSIIEIDKDAKLRLFLDPSTTDSLVVKGEASLGCIMDRSGKLSLTGVYDLKEGSYLLSMESIIKKKFEIVKGSTINWSGDPMNAQIEINASYSVRAASIDLMVNQITGGNEADKSAYKGVHTFIVLLKLRGEIMHPEISFEIQLAPEDKGIIGGSVNSKLLILNENPSALNKQVFALLILGRFVQDNPLLTESNATSNLVRSTVGKYLSSQINQLSSKFIHGVDLNVDIQSYDYNQLGKSTGRTQLDIGVKKQLFKDRLTIQLGGSLEIEGEKAKQNSANDLTSDFLLEYKISEDGRYRVKAFRHNQYQGEIDGQLIETGTGLMYVRDFDKWKDFLFKPKIKAKFEK